MNLRDYMRGSVAVAPMALLALSCSAVYADTLDFNPLIGTSGGGYIYVDLEESVVEPGIKAVTFTKTRIGSGNADDNFYDEPQDNVVTDFSALTSRGQVSNCLMASNANFCDSAPGTGKRIKNRITGMDAFDTRFRTTSGPYELRDGTEEVNTGSVDYFTFGKMSNFSGARMTGFDIELLDKDGKLMNVDDPDNAVLFNLAATKIGLGAGLTDGLFGDGGQEGDDLVRTGFFVSGSKAVFEKIDASNKLQFGALTLPGYVEHFGNGYLDNTMVPDGLFWDDSAGAEEASLIAWNNLAGGGWTYGNLAKDAALEARLAALADALDVDDVSALAYEAGKLIPAEILAAAKANGLFEVLPIEDLRNANLNYTMTIGKVDGNEFTVRISPKFAKIVTGATSDTQLKNAIYLDTLAEVPYLNTVEGSAADYQAAIDSLIAQDDAAKT